MANVVFLWHMHQPYYVNPTSKVAMMPWVRLHAVKGYLDMVSVLAEFPDVHVNINLTPVLMLQIEELVRGEIRDLWLDWSRKPAADLDENERLAILEHFFKIRHDNLLDPFPRYAELHAKRGLFQRDRVRAELRHWSTEDFRDLQMWYNLAWCGFTASRLYPELAAMKRKERNFSEEEKLRVLAIHMEILASIPQLYAAAEKRGQAELTTTPFFHPILPLVYDSDFAARAMPGRALPHRFHWPQDAQAQLDLAVAQHTRMFGRAPRGLWPSEGSIAPELVPLMQKAGIRYFCSDEENLFNSLRREGIHADHLELFQAWRVEHGGASVNAVFREKPLSDFVGFMASRNDPHDSAAHLLMHLRHIANHVPRDTGLIPVILDGENAWETFRDGGETFLREVYRGLSKGGGGQLRSTTIENHLLRCPPRKTLQKLHSGSWISSNFDIWIGEEEENRAWDLLGQTRHFLEGKLPSLTPEQRAAALHEVYAAEGSDWFWWYGPDFTTECDQLFDDLFRQHLKNVYSLCGEVSPPELDRSIITTEKAALYTPPRRQITPLINGKLSPFYEWVGSGLYIAGSEQGAMFRDDRFLRSVRFGCDAQRLHLRLDLRRAGDFTVTVVFHQPAEMLVQTPPATRGGTGKVTLRRNGTAGVKTGEFAADEIVEFSVPFAELDAQEGSAVQFQVKVFEKGIERECYPENSPIELAVPAPGHALAEWVV